MVAEPVAVEDHHHPALGAVCRDRGAVGLEHLLVPGEALDGFRSRSQSEVHGGGPQVHGIAFVVDESHADDRPRKRSGGLEEKGREADATGRRLAATPLRGGLRCDARPSAIGP